MLKSGRNVAQMAAGCPRLLLGQARIAVGFLTWSPLTRLEHLSSVKKILLPCFYCAFFYFFSALSATSLPCPYMGTISGSPSGTAHSNCMIPTTSIIHSAPLVSYSMLNVRPSLYRYERLPDR
jgi:hypothetical protein